MKKTILHRASELFLKYGFKSVTMDDIANALVISKKTIYKYFKNKEALVDEATIFVQKTIYNSVLRICNEGHNAIQENYEIKKMFKDLFKISDDSPIYELQKYYPKTYYRIKTNEFSMFKDCISKNIIKGINEGLYRKDIDSELMTKFYFSLVISAYDSTLYSYNKNTINKLERSVLEYHLRAIVTLKGLKILEEKLKKCRTLRVK